MEKEELINYINTICECYDISKIYKIEYRGKDVKGKNKYKISYTANGADFVLITKFLTEK